MTRPELVYRLFDLAGEAYQHGHADLAAAIEGILTFEPLGLTDADVRRRFAALDRMAEGGRRGGSATSPAKAEAARRNGQRGGRPKK